jgi:hypothetical protein
MGACLGDHLADVLASLKATADDPPVRVPAALVESIEEGRMVYALDGECTACQGLGEVPDGSGGWRPCRCVSLRRIAERLTVATLPAPDGRALPWEPVPAVPIRGGRALDLAKLGAVFGVDAEAMAARVAASSPSSMLIHGANGAGKTTLAGVLARRWIIAGASVRFVRWPEVLRGLRAAQREDGGGYNVEIMRLSSPGPQVLVLDEVGADKGSEWVASVAEEVIGVRLERGAVTVVVTNSDPGTTLAHQLGDRTRSRLARCARSVPFGLKTNQTGEGARR